jgi:hypothetical protein
VFPAERFTVAPGPCLALAALLLAAHGVAGSVPWLLGLPPAVGMAVDAVLLCQLALVAGDHALRRMPWSVRALAVRSDGSAVVLRKDGLEQAGRILADTWSSRRWIVVNLGLDSGRRRSLVLGPGALPPDQQRRLRVFLAWGLRRPAGAPGGAPAGP